MAGDWIKITVDLPAKPEVWVISDALNIDVDAVVGKLVRIFSWFDAQSENGNAPSVTEKLLDREAGVTGFIDAMRKAGWIVDRGGEIHLINFERHNGQTAKTRALGAKRQSKHRNYSVTLGALPEKRREEKKFPPTPRRDNRRTRDISIEESIRDTSWAKN